MGAFGSKNGLFHDICIRSGLRNGAAIAGLKRGEHLSKEKIVSTDPDLFIFPRYSATKKGDVDKLREDVLNDQSLQTVKAVKIRVILLLQTDIATVLRSIWLMLFCSCQNRLIRSFTVM